jgi:hypothetical protein
VLYLEELWYILMVSVNKLPLVISLFCFIRKFDIFPLMCAVDKVWITELTLIH